MRPKLLFIDPKPTDRNAHSTVLLVLALVALVGGAAAQLYRGESYSHTNGKPGCRTAAEFNVKWANNYDNLRYWLCTDAGAVSYVCPTEFLFHYDRQCCVRWNFWTWSAPFDPPTLADV